MESRRLDDIARTENDRYKNLEIEYRRVQMELEMMGKDKDSEIRRLTRDRERDSWGLA